MHTWAEIGFWASAGILFYSYFGYGLLLALLRAVRGVRPVPPHAADYRPKVSLIIPAYNEERVLRAKLENSLALDYPAAQLEIIVVSDGSTDDTEQIARAFAERGVVLVAAAERRGKSSALNLAVQAASGELLCFCDANVMFSRNALSKLVDRLADPEVGAASGDVRLMSHLMGLEHGESLYYRFERWLQLAETHVGSLIGVDGGMYVLRRELFQPLAPDTILDDFTLTMQVLRRGQRAVYEPAAIAHEDGPPTTRQEFARRVRLSAGSVQSIRRRFFPPWSSPIELWQYLSHKLLRWCGPFVLVVALVCNLRLWSQGALYQAALIAQLAAYLLAVVAAVSLAVRKTRLGGVAFYVLMSHLAMAWGTLAGLFNLQPVTWAKTERQVSPEELKVVA